MNQPTEPQATVTSPHALLCGGEQVTVAYANGKTETVLVRLMTLRQLQSYIVGIENVSDLIELACQKPKGWADELLPNSALMVDEVVRRLNDPTLDRLIERQVSAVQRMKPMMQKLTVLASST